MKKVLSILTLLLVSLLLVSCQDKKTHDNSINVMFYTYNNDQNPIDSYLNLEEGSLIDEPETPIRLGFRFLGWFKDQKHTTPWNFATDKVGNKAIVIYAKWESGKYSITYETAGGQMPNNDYVKEFEIGDRKTLPSPTLVGYTFVSWYSYPWLDENGKIQTKPGDRGYQLVPSDKPEDIILYAHWRAVVVNVTFDNNFPVDAINPPARVNSRSVSYNDIINFHTFSDYEHPEYEFAGWNSRRDGTGNWFVNGELFTNTQRLTVYAIWNKK